MHPVNPRNNRNHGYRNSLLVGLAVALSCPAAQATAPKAAIAVVPTTLSSSDRMFLSDAMSWNQKEIDISHDAVAHADSAKVREFAQALVRDYTALIADYEKVDIAILPPAASTQPNPNLVGLKGAEFDKAYLRIIIADHDRTIARFQIVAGSQVWSRPVREAAGSALPMLRRHDDEAKSLEQGLPAR